MKYSQSSSSFSSFSSHSKTAVNNIDVISSEALHKLQKLELCIIGNNRSTEVLLANTIGLGVLKHSIYGQRKSRLLSDSFLENNSRDLMLYFSNKPFEDQDLQGLSYSHIVVTDPTLSLRQKKVLKNYAQKSSSFLYFVEDEEVISGGIKCSIVADEIRKQIVQLHDFDKPLLCDFSYKTCLEKDSSFFSSSLKKILAIGAGGIGNYFSMGLANHSLYEVTLVDDDIFEEKNRNRQIFCRPSKYKTSVIEKEVSNVSGIPQRFNSQLIKKLDSRGYVPDILVGCVDNLQTRLLMMDYASKRSIPYFDGGVSMTSGQVMFNPTYAVSQVSNQDLYLEHQKARKKKMGCAFKQNPSIVVPNCIVGLQLAQCVLSKLPETGFYRFQFDSSRDSRIIEKINGGRF